MALATERQVNFINLLLDQREVATDLREYAKKARTMRMSVASDLITHLLKAPHKQVAAAPNTSTSAEPNSNSTRPTLPDVPDGRYAIEGEDGTLKFYHYDRPTEGRWAGYTFLKARASDEKWPIKNYETKRAILAEIAKDPKAAAVRFGLELGECSICGRSLTDEDSRARGIGPVCAEKRGWL